MRRSSVSRVPGCRGASRSGHRWGEAGRSQGRAGVFGRSPWDRSADPRHSSLLCSTRPGELLGLKWEDVDFDRRRLHIRRAYVKGGLTTPKNGKGRFVAMPPALAELLLDLLAERRRQTLGRGWSETPDWIFPCETSGPIHPDNFSSVWLRIRRRAAKIGVRP
ncbi:MAG: tyrosine-type recombinase/integrase, partial [Deltaproteobacteria bacterium]|nr:tyrosine-type recombinase/integrase [Deltaproteobacteria bacterium]